MFFRVLAFFEIVHAFYQKIEGQDYMFSCVIAIFILLLGISLTVDGK